MINKDRAVIYTHVNKNGAFTLARSAIFGWDLISRWKANIDLQQQNIFIRAQNNKFGIKFFFTNHLIAKDNNNPSVTNLVQFTIGTGDHPPAYQAPILFHPNIQKQIDVKFAQLCTSGIFSKVYFL